jgi:uncharacterized circularly permuted ATP-grasp superfamily protein/uncharacterized alpha-E superfamily protein
MTAARDEPRDEPFDEPFDHWGRLRPHWRRVLGSLLGLGASVIAERMHELDLAYAQEPGKWRCDPVPLLFTEAEFLELTAALGQRATLLEALLADVYGPQTALAAGVLPPALVFPSPAYLRPCRDMPGRHMQLYAADLVHQPDGAWRVLADRTAEPAGLAYALENRRLMAGVLPELFRAAEISPLRPFFDSWQDALQRLAPGQAGAPGLAVLTHGHADPHWFEQMVLARELGFVLVEDGDLTVRGGALLVKTLRGLSPVHVLLRRQPGGSIDPLEMNGAASVGVPGLLCAMRAGTVAVLNGAGAGFAQAPGLAAFLPVLARHFLGQELALPSVETLWLGDVSARARVLADPGAWSIGPVHEAAVGAVPLADIVAHPWAYAAQARPTPSLAPCISPDGKLTPRGIVVRLFLVWDGAAWQPLQGGVARVAEAGDVLEAGGAGPCIAKDVWVLMQEGRTIVGPTHIAVAALPIRRMAGDLPSRVAENFYWFGRYLERLENAARLTRAMLARLGRPTLTPRDVPDMVALAACLTEAGMLSADIGAGAGAGVLTEQLRRAMAADQGVMGRLTVRVQDLAENLRDRLSGDMHSMVAHGVRSLKGARLALAPGVRGRQVASLGFLADFAGRVLEFCATVSGYAAENMVRGGGHLFLDLGRRIERAQCISLHLALSLDQKPERVEAGLSLALELCDSTLTYRSRYLSVLQPATVLDLVLTDEGNPRSLGFQLAAMRRMLAVLGDQHNDALFRMLDAPIDDMRAMLSDLVATEDPAACAAALPPRLRDIFQQLGALSTAVGRQYFAHLPASRTDAAPPT